MARLMMIAFSDLHIHLWNKFNESNKRTLNHFRVLSIIKKICVSKGIPAVFCGDMFHDGESISNELLNLSIDEMLKIEDGKFACFAISGNHCMSQRNSKKNVSPSLLRAFSKIIPWLKCIDFEDRPLIGVAGKNIMLHGIPYIDNNKGLNGILSAIETKKSGIDYDILMIHSDFPGAVDTDDRRIDTVENLNTNLLRKFDLVLCGHIHKPQKLGKKTYMIGAPLQQRRTDRNCKLGYWEIYDDLTVVFKEITGMPKFIDVTSDEDIKDDGNYYTVVNKKKKRKPLVSNPITKEMGKTKIATKYLRSKEIKDKGKKKKTKLSINKADNDD